MANIAIFLETKAVLKASQSSNAMTKLLKKHLPSIKCTEASQAKTFGLFRFSEGALFGCAHVLKVTSIAGNPSRIDALKNWIKSQDVSIDADGFLVRKQHFMNFGSNGLECVRIKLWDKPLCEIRTYYGTRNDYMTTLYLQADFFPLMYNP
jgi:hypothetical protein